ncbi:hypothetical protein ACFE04_004282 [Oxalis oulophora]
MEVFEARGGGHRAVLRLLLSPHLLRPMLLMLMLLLQINRLFEVNCVLWRSKKTVMEALFGGGNDGLAATVGAVMLFGGVVVGAWIRRRQWRRVFRAVEEGGGRDRVGLNLVGRVEKLEQDLKLEQGREWLVFET